MELGDDELGDERLQVRCEKRGAVRARRRRARANAAVIERHDGEAGRSEGGDLKGPCFLGAGETVDQDDAGLTACGGH